MDCRRNLSLIEQLPSDCMGSVLSFLFLHELNSLSLSSSRLNQATIETTHLYTSANEAFVSENQLESLVSKFKSLKVLYLHGLAPVGDALFDILNGAATTIREIHLYDCCLSCWSSTTLTLDHLTHLTIAGGSIRADLESFVSSNHLQSVTIGQCTSLRDEHIHDLCYRLKKTLEDLSLNQCLKLHSPKIQGSSLRHLNLKGCFAMEDLPDFDCPLLTSLSLSFCFQLKGACIQNLMNQLEHLTDLSLVMCPLLTSLSIHSSSLQSCDISLSNNLQDLNLHCNLLLHLDTVSCTSLREVTIVSSSLTALNLSMLPMNELELHTPALVNLRLCGCQRLTDSHVHIYAPKLMEADICGTSLASELLFLKHVSHVKHGVSTLL